MSLAVLEHAVALLLPGVFWAVYGRIRLAPAKRLPALITGGATWAAFAEASGREGLLHREPGRQGHARGMLLARDGMLEWQPEPYDLRVGFLPFRWPLAEVSRVPDRPSRFRPGIFGRPVRLRVPQGEITFSIYRYRGIRPENLKPVTLEGN